MPIESLAPSWWNLDESGTPAVRSAPAATKPRTRPTRDPVGGEGLFAQSGDSWVDALFASTVYADQRKIAGRAPLPDDRARQIIDVFVQYQPGHAKPKMTEQALAARLELSVADTRRRVTLLRNLLNVDGYEVLAQPDRDSLELDVGLLMTQFSIGGGIA